MNNRREFVPLAEIKSGQYDDRQVKCLYYNRTLCQQTGNKGCGESVQICPSIDNSDHNTGDAYCYALWRNSTDEGVQLVFKGCWFGASKSCSNDEIYGQSSSSSTFMPNQQHHKAPCVPTHPPKQKDLNFCCCKGILCNEEVKQMPELLLYSTPPPEEPGVITTTKESHDYRLSDIIFYVLLIMAIIFLASVASMIVYFFGKCPRKPHTDDVPTHEPLLIDGTNLPTIGYNAHPITLKEALANGKFGTVYQAVDGHNRQVAVKVFSMQDRSSWQIEKDVYSLPQMEHDNILKYLGAERKGEGLGLEFWIITEYHPNGSLHEYLKSHTVTWNNLLKIIQGIGLGLAHLHEEIPARENKDAKPSVAHRDFKSKNVLLGNNFRACIADFGLALVFYPNTTCGDAHGQVGTRRYMAPEVLEGAINFTRDSFLKIDMYACGLVLWELVSRCSYNEIPCDEYSLPFENEVGPNPTIEDMQDIVAQQKKRPHIKDSWLKHPGMALIVSTMQDCWDQEAEARISAETICERINSLKLNNDSTFNQANISSSNNHRTAMATTTTPIMATTNNNNLNNNHHVNNNQKNLNTTFLPNIHLHHHHLNHNGGGSPMRIMIASHNNNINNNQTSANGVAYMYRETGT
ncbi:Activin receptor type-2A [Dermatophagoides farinae]|uniref:Serine/threonine-protein kinase receptor n=1 Tax=Dermatophagoides farinae TaxID=6954 RepID=A0A922HS44_DERFA|nr:Activin receptor type-2A [Dermatophagoides farinae]